MDVIVQGKKIGTLKEKIFRKRVKGSKHLMRKLDAWGLDMDVLNELPEDGEIRILDTDDQKIYSTSVDVFKGVGVAREFGHHGLQMFLPRKYWEVKGWMG